MGTPFSFGKIVSGREFTDRENETAWLVQQWEAGNNCMIISPRRWGKSSLVAHAAGKMQQQNRRKLFCFIDLYNIRTEHEFYEVYARELLKASSNGWEDIMRNIKLFFKHLIPRVTVSPTPDTDLGLAFDWKELKKNPSEILNLSEAIGRSKKKEVVICMDEFQNINFFEDPLALQKKLRSHWQKHRHTSYCLYGSKRHLLMDFFTRTSMPFYQFGEILFLEKIAASYWVPFICNGFAASGKSITEEQAEHIARVMDNHPYFVQQLAQAIWLQTVKKCSDDIMENTLADLLDQYTILYQKEVEQLTNPQLNFLKAVCDKVEKFSSSEIIREYRLGTSANVVRIKKSLENKELIDIAGTKIQFNDPLFESWLKQKYFNTSSGQKI